MKVSTLAACALAGLSTNALAQSSVTLYGVIDMAVQSARTGGATTNRVESSSVAPTRFGFQGAEDLGGGTQAIFRLESGFYADTGVLGNGGALFGREAWAGLKGSFGQIQAGVNYTPLFLSYVAYSLGELNTLGWGNATNNFVFVPAALASNSIRYTSPTFAGATLRAFYSAGNENAAGQPKDAGKSSSVGLNYKLGQFSIDGDYLQQDYVNAATLTTTELAHTGRYWLLGASYDFGVVKPAFLYQAHHGAPDVAAANRTTYANPDNHFYEVNALVHVTPTGTVLVSYGQYKQLATSTGDARSYALRYDYRLSKRSGLYAGVTRVANESTASFTAAPANGPGMPVGAGQSINAVILGMIHRF